MVFLVGFEFLLYCLISVGVPFLDLESCGRFSFLHYCFCTISRSIIYCCSRCTILIKILGFVVAVLPDVAMTMDTVVVVVDDADVVVQPRQNCIVKHDRRLDTNQEKFERKIRLNKNVSVISKVHVQYFKVFVLPKLMFSLVLFFSFF
jgi:hypothetical protein